MDPDSRFGKNRWSDSQLQKLLNDGYSMESVGGSLYWDSETGTCYGNNEKDSALMKTYPCDFKETGLKDSAKAMIEDAKWYLGASDYNANILTETFYQNERDTKVWNSTSYPRETNWIGKVALFYASDYGYATSGGSNQNREACLKKELTLWSDENYTDCKNNNWLFDILNVSTVEKAAFTINPSINTASHVHTVLSVQGKVKGEIGAWDSRLVYPTVYLKKDILFQDGDGSKNNPYILKNFS